MSSRTIVKNTIFLYIRQIIVLVLGLYTTRLTLKILGVSDFGIFAAIAGVTAMLKILTNTMASGTTRYLTVELGKGNLKQMNHVYITSIHIHLIVALLLVMLGETVGLWFLNNKMMIPEERMDVALWVFQISLANIVLDIINVPNEAEITAHEDFGIIAVLSVSGAILKLLFVILLFFISWDKLLVYSFALFIIQVFNRLVSVWYCKIHYTEVKYHYLYDKKLMTSMLKLSGWVGLSNMAVMGFIQGVNIILNIFFGPVLNAAYSVAIQAYSGIRIFSSHFQLASNPQIMKLYSTGEIKKMHQLLFSVCKMSFFLVFVLSLPFLIYAEFVLRLWLGTVPDHTTLFFTLLLIYAYIDIFAYPLDIAAQVTGRMKKYSIYVSIISLISLPLAYLAYLFGAIPEMIYEIAIMMACVGLIIRVALLSKLISFKKADFYHLIILRVAIVSALSLVIPLLFKYITTESLTTVAVGFVITYLLTSIIIYNIGLDNKEKQLVQNFVERMPLFGKCK